MSEKLTDTSFNPNSGIVHVPELEKLPILDNLGVGEKIITALPEGVETSSSSEEVVLAVETLMTDFEIDVDTINSSKDKLILLALGDKLSQLERRKGSIDSTSYIEEKEKIADILMLSVGDHTRFRSLLRPPDKQYEPSDERRKEIYERYSNSELTAEFSQFIKGSDFGEVKKRLGITTEEPFSVAVLNIDTPDGMMSYGLDRGISDEEWNANYEAANDHMNIVNAYKKGLISNGEKFNKELNQHSAMPPAWVTTYQDGSRVLCVASPTAEKVMYTNEARSSYYTEDELDRDLALIKHEYVHTQKAIMTGEFIGAGIGLEELRAEHFSGDKHGYTDVKRFFQGVKAITGYSPKDSFERDGLPYDEDRFMIEIVENLGLDVFLDVMTTVPGNYAKEAVVKNPFLSSMIRSQGGSLSSHFQKIYDKSIAKLGKETVENNINIFVDRIRDSLKDSKVLTVEAFVSYGGINSFAKLCIDNFRSRYPNESDSFDYFAKQK